MIRVEEAEKIIQSQACDYGMESIYFENAAGRVLAENITADRDLPPYNRVTMDGIAVRYEAFEKGKRSFKIKAVQAAGDVPVDIENDNECIEIMTGAALPSTTDTVIPYEHIDIKDCLATAKHAIAVNKGQSIHYKGRDKLQGDVLVPAGCVIDPVVINIAAALGKTEMAVKKLPRIVIISTGDELAAVNETPLPYQVRRSNNYAIKATLEEYGITPGMLHLPDNHAVIKQELKTCLDNYDVILLSGGISMGKFDYVPQVLDELAVKKLFHKVQQRPGKPFWFGTHANGAVVFAFPGNPVSTYMCLHRYCIPWLKASTGIKNRETFAVLNTDFVFTPALQYFLQVELQVYGNGQIMANPLVGNGSGDFANLAEAGAFMELPLERNDFKKGEVFRIWPFRKIY